MKVAFANTSRSWGGEERMAAALIRGFAARSHQVLLLCRRGTPLEHHLRDEVPCASLPPDTLLRLHLLRLPAAVRLLRQHRPDALVVSRNPDLRVWGLAARLLKIPVLRRYEIDLPIANRKPYHRLYYGWVPTRQVAVSSAVRETMLQSAPWIRPEKVSIIYNGVDDARFARGETAALPVPPGAATVGFVGRMEERKGVLDLGTAWARVASALPNAHLVMVGDGKDERAVRARLDGLPRVRWLGFRDDVAPLMRAFDVVAAPSHYEGFGLVVAEAMAAGTPVVVTRTSNFPELVTDGVEGRLVEPRCPDELADALIALLSDAELRAAMGRAGRARVRRGLTLDAMLDQHEALLQEVVAANAGMLRSGDVAEAQVLSPR